MNIENNTISNMTPEMVGQTAAIKVLDNTLEMAAQQGQQLVEMMTIQDPMLGQNIDISV
jgi:hypothetical protein